ncbi:tRNA (mnm(5)s(2)U34)-methyltransferase / FAD-dependent cmnm(5)s(2)U34 oxidoreductase [Pararobbsia alpina]|uniref:FAD-dependent 5-carboxymethylaminomethyl-2-thiouridine(34) oxidoreductase MnmC n=1 Tax=Pararobbsia alpina TaxID=621374 RepID=UPI0039A51301
MTHVPVASDDPSDLSARWRDRSIYTVLDLRSVAREEFLRAWRQWRADSFANRCATLHFVAVIANWKAEDKGSANRSISSVYAATHAETDQKPERNGNATAADTDSCTDALDAAWPTRVAGMHRIEFEQGRVVLTLAFSSVADALAELWLRADEVRFDDSSISSDADASARSVIKGIARLAGVDATLIVAGDAVNMSPLFSASGFQAHPDAASTSTSESTPLTRTFRFAPRWRVRRHEPPAARLARDRGGFTVNASASNTFNPEAASAPTMKTHVPSTNSLSAPQSNTRSPTEAGRVDAIIIGAGLAGCALAERLASRGLRLAIIDAGDGLATGASGNPAGVFHPVVANDDSLASRATRAGFLYALSHWHSLEQRGFPFDWQADGLVQVATNADEEASLRTAIESFDLPRDLVRYVSVEDAEHLLEVRPAFGGLMFERGGRVNPASLCHAQIRAAQASTSVDLIFDRRIDRLESLDDIWFAYDAEGECIAQAPVVVVANSNDASRLASLAYAPTRPIRGQLTWVDDTALAALRLPLIGDGYLLPRTEGSTHQLTGASYELDDEDTALRETSQRENIGRLQHLVPASASALEDPARTLPLTGRVALRCATSDRMPMIGQLGDEHAARSNAPALSGAWPLDLPRQPGLFGAYGYGSRGLIWAALGAEIIASQVMGEPSPVPRSLLDAFDPARFLMRALRQRDIQ